VNGRLSFEANIELKKNRNKEIYEKIEKYEEKALHVVWKNVKTLDKSFTFSLCSNPFKKVL